jgi:outer membrane lipoprotein carrier protein
MQSAANGENFLLRPKNKDMSFKWIALEFQHNQLRSMKVLNNLDETSEYQFKQIEINRPLLPNLFQFQAPNGVDVVNQ